MMYLVELITTMTLVHNMDVPSSTPIEKPSSQSIISNNGKKKGTGTSSSKSKNGNSKKNTGSSKGSPKKTPTKKSSAQKKPTKSSSSSSKRPPPRTTSSSSSSSRSTSQSKTSRPKTSSHPSTRPSTSRTSSSSPSKKSNHSSKSHSSTQSQRPSSRPVHHSQRSTPQSKSSKPTVNKNSNTQKMKSVHQNQSKTNVPKTSSGVKVHPSHSKSKIKKPSSDPHKSSNVSRSQDVKRTQAPNISPEELKERREALQNKKTQTTKPEKSIKELRPPTHKPNTVPNRGNRYDSTIDRGNTGHRITPSSSHSKGGLKNDQRTDSRVGKQNVNDRRNNQNQEGFSTNRNTGPVVIVVEKPSSTPDGWNPEIHRQSSGEDRQWHPNYWGAGVFYYTEPPQNVYIEEHNYYGDTVRKYEAPRRKCDRRKSLSVGLRGGTLGSQVEDFSQDDISWGGSVGYRLFDPIGLEVSYIKTGDEWTTGLKAPAQVSGNLYLFPWTGVSPYITGGISVAEQAGAKNQTDFDLPDGYAYGPHGGVGIEWGIGNHISLNAEGRYTKFKNVDATHTQLSAGLNFYF